MLITLMARSGIFYNDRFDNIGNIFHLIGNLFNILQDVFMLDQFNGVLFIIKQR